jgi:hypothetical protein
MRYIHIPFEIPFEGHVDSQYAWNMLRFFREEFCQRVVALYGLILGFTFAFVFRDNQSCPEILYWYTQIELSAGKELTMVKGMFTTVGGRKDKVKKVPVKRYR